MSKFKISLREPLVCPALDDIHSTLFGSNCLLCEVPKWTEHLKVNRNQTLCLKVYLLPFVNTPGFYFLLHRCSTTLCLWKTGFLPPAILWALKRWAVLSMSQLLSSCKCPCLSPTSSSPKPLSLWAVCGEPNKWLCSLLTEGTNASKSWGLVRGFGELGIQAVLGRWVKWKLLYCWYYSKLTNICENT